MTANFYSIIDAINIFANFKNDPRRYWNDKKKALIGNNDELSEKIGRLKLLATDGKYRLTDVMPFWGMFTILVRIDTPASNDFTNKVLQGYEDITDLAMLKYRAMNIERGYEWGAEGVHERMKELDTPSDHGLVWWQK